MLRAEDLMVGDYLTFTDVQNDSRCPKLKVVVIDGATNELLVSVDGDPTLDRIDIDDELCGIPITPEILEKNGFRKLVTYGTKKWLCDNFRLNVYDSRETWRFCADTNRNEDSVIYIRFVHELQHCLKLCGIDKTIEL